MDVNQNQRELPEIPGIGKRINLTAEKTIRIAVSGDVHLTETELKIIDTPEFQRLRNIKQLGVSYLVYPSAIHTRFEHSLGTLKIADQMAENVNKAADHMEERYRKKGIPEKPIRISDEDREIIRLCALLHDITQIPFGHTLEDETHVIVPDHDSKERIERFLGEDNKNIGKLLKDRLGERYETLKDVLQTKSPDVNSLGEKAYICDIVKNTVCADLLDYVGRDAFFCNLRSDFGDRFLKFLHLARYKKENEEKEAIRLVIRLWKEEEKRHRRDLIDELIHLLNARFLLGSSVYFHHAKIITSAMLARAVKMALREGILKKEKLLYELGDEEVFYILRQAKGEVGKLATALHERRLYKDFDECLISREKAEAQEERYSLLEELEKKFNKDADNRVKQENLLCEDCKKQQGEILIYCPEKEMSLKEADMLVLWKEKIQPLKEMGDELTRSKINNIIESHKNLWSLKVLVHPDIEEEIEKGTFDKHLLKSWCEYRIEGKEDFREALDMTVLSYSEELGKVPQNLRSKIYDNLKKSARGGENLVTRKRIEREIEKILNKKEVQSDEEALPQ